jgi:arylsulfatase A-like enzyme
MCNRRDFLKSVGVGCLSSLPIISCINKNRKQKRPNILFIMSDDHASHAISAYGSQINKTPNIDRIAQEGIRFDNCFCTNSICAPSRATMLTGKYSHLNGVVVNRSKFDGTQQTLPKLLQKAGYETAMVGKWHLKSAPTGFDYRTVLPGQGFYQNPVFVENGKEQKHSGYVTDIITDKALQWFKSRQSEKPFFMMLHHKAPHADWIPDEKHQSMFSERDVPLPATFNDDHKTRTRQIKNHRLHVGPKQWELHFEKRFGKIPDGKTEQETREWVYQKYMKNYLRCVASVDDNIGRVLDYLKESKLAENTIVVYTSDQGFFLGDHGLYDKRFMYEHSLRMPLLMKYPREIKENSFTDKMVLNVDFAPTFLDYAKAPVPDDIQGASFKPIADGTESKNWRKAMYYRFYEDGFGVGPHEGIRSHRYKLVHFLYGDKGWELYDLEKDPNELVNIFNEQKNKKIVEKLLEEMSALKKKYKFE